MNIKRVGLAAFAAWIIWIALLGAATSAVAVVPQITSANNATFTAGVSNTFTVVASGTPPASIIKRGKKLPTGVTYVNHNDGTGTLSGTPTGVGGTTKFRWVASNSDGRDSQNFTLTVNAAPHITSAPALTCAIGAACSLTLTATGFPVPSIALTSGSLPAGINYNAATKTLSGTAQAATNGTYPVDFTASNGTLPNDVQHFVLTVNTSLHFTSGASTTCEVGSPCAFSITATGAPNGGTVSQIVAPPTSVALPADVVFQAGAAGSGTASLSGTPLVGAGGIYTLEFSTTNGVETATQFFTLTVNEQPAFTSGTSFSCQVGVFCTFEVTTTGVPNPVTSLVVGPGGGDALPAGAPGDPMLYTDNGDGTGGSFDGTPAAGTAGIYGLVFSATNGIGTDATQSFTLTVGQAPAITSAAPPNGTVGTAYTFTYTATGSPAPTFAVTAGAAPDGLLLDSATGILSGTPTLAGPFTGTVTASNGFAPAATQNFSITIANPIVAPGAPTAVTAAGGDGQGVVSFTAPVSDGGSPITGYTATCTPLAGPPGVTATGAGSPITVTGLTNGVTYTCTVHATNGVPLDSPESAASNQITPASAAVAPGAPTGVSALSGNAQGVVSFTAPVSDGGSPISGYTVTCTPVAGPPGVTASGTASPITVAGLTNGVKYTCTVHATNGVPLDSVESAASNPITPSAAAPATLTVTLHGAGAGTVGSLPPGIACPGDCAELYPAGTGVILTATPAPGSVFTGWLGGGCGLTPTCTVTVNTATSVAAYFALQTVISGPATLDIDGSAPTFKYDALTDGLLAIRYLFGVTGTPLIGGAIGGTATRTTSAAVIAYLDAIYPALDIDGNGQVDALTDGLLIIRYLFGLNGASLIQGAVGLNAARTTPTDIATYLNTLMP